VPKAVGLPILSSLLVPQLVLFREVFDDTAECIRVSLILIFSNPGSNIVDEHQPLLAQSM
jgi:hypothetical protein